MMLSETSFSLLTVITFTLISPFSGCANVFSCWFGKAKGVLVAWYCWLQLSGTAE